VCSFNLLISIALAAAAPPAASGGVRGTVELIGLSVGSRINDVSDVLIFVEGLTAPVPKASQPHTITQQGKKFTPARLIVPAGETVVFPNADDVQHNVFSLAPARQFDLPLYKKGESRSVKFDVPGIVPVFCNIHPQMRAHVVVVSNPFYGAPDKEGRFQFSGLPAGEYTLVAWHHMAKIVKQTIRIEPGRMIVLEPLIVRESTIGTTHLNKEGKAYGAY
jgi:plastocyanin